MIRHGGSVRFTSRELEQFRKIGLDFSDTRYQTNLEQELNRWANVIARERPDLLEKIARALAEAQGLHGRDRSASGKADDV